MYLTIGSLCSKPLVAVSKKPAVAKSPWQDAGSRFDGAMGNLCCSENHIAVSPAAENGPPPAPAPAPGGAETTGLVRADSGGGAPQAAGSENPPADQHAEDALAGSTDAQLSVRWLVDKDPVIRHSHFRNVGMRK